MAYRYRPVVRDQGFLLPPDVRDWLPDGHLAWFVIDAVGVLDLSRFRVQQTSTPLNFTARLGAAAPEHSTAAQRSAASPRKPSPAAKPHPATHTDHRTGIAHSRPGHAKSSTEYLLRASHRYAVTIRLAAHIEP